MKKSGWIALGIIACLAITAGAYFHVTGLMESLFVYRSPLHSQPPAPGPALGAPLTHRVVFVLVDALRDDTSHKPAVMPFLNELRGQAAWATIHSRTPSYSDPGWTVLMTGAWPDISDGPAMNTPYEETPAWTQDNLFSAAHRAGLATAVSGFNWWEKLIPQAAVDVHFYTPGEDQAADRQVMDAALPWLKSGNYPFILIHIDQVDYAGHYQGGPRSPNWDAAATRADALLKEIVSYLNLTQDTVIIVSDHGQIDQGGHGGQEAINLVEPLVLAGAGVKPGQYADIQQVDVAPTVAVLLGLNIPATAQGFVKTDMLALTAGQKAAVDAAQLTQKSQLAAAYLASIGSSAKLPASSSASTLVLAMDAAKTKRLNSERLPRLILALLLAAIPAVVLIVKRSKTIAWWVGGALIYLILYHFQYAILAGRTYSLSSVLDANDFIMSTGITSAMALLFAWLAMSLGLRLFNKPTRQAAMYSLGFVFITLYLLALPIAWSYALNGGLLSWTLPDVASRFLEVLFTLQGMIVAVTGLLLTGMSALITFLNGFYHRRSVAKGTASPVSR